MLRRSLVLVAAVVAAFVVAASALAAGVTVRVEGKTQTIFGSRPAKVDAANALQALDLASVLGEFFYGLTHSSFGDYVSQIGRYPAGGSAGWVFKVNGVSPPVGADQVQLKDGDSVLWYWAEFGPNGGPPTLEPEARTARTATGRLSRRRAARRRPRRPPSSTSTGGASGPTGGPRLRRRAIAVSVRAFAVGAVPLEQREVSPRRRLSRSSSPHSRSRAAAGRSATLARRRSGSRATAARS